MDTSGEDCSWNTLAYLAEAMYPVLIRLLLVLLPVCFV